MHVDQAAMVNAVAAVKFSFDKEKVPSRGKPTVLPLKYAFPYDAETIEELDRAAASGLLQSGEVL
jgi:hypothetical protein